MKAYWTAFWTDENNLKYLSVSRVKEYTINLITWCLLAFDFAFEKEIYWCTQELCTESYSKHWPIHDYKCQTHLLFIIGILFRRGTMPETLKIKKEIENTWLHDNLTDSASNLSRFLEEPYLYDNFRDTLNAIITLTKCQSKFSLFSMHLNMPQENQDKRRIIKLVVKLNDLIFII